jgi:hypothetical protein
MLSNSLVNLIIIQFHLNMIILANCQHSNMMNTYLHYMIVTMSFYNY